MKAYYYTGPTIDFQFSDGTVKTVRQNTTVELSDSELAEVGQSANCFVEQPAPQKKIARKEPSPVATPAKPVAKPAAPGE